MRDFEKAIDRVSCVLDRFGIRTEIRQYPYVNNTFSHFSRSHYEVRFEMTDSFLTRYTQSFCYGEHFYTNPYADSIIINNVLSGFSKMFLDQEKLAEIVLEN